MTMTLLAAVLPFAAVGFTLLVQTSPLGRYTFKPFSCRVCLSGWGSILTAVLVLAAHGQWNQGGPTDADLAIWFALSCYGTGAARVIFSAADALQASADRASPISFPSDIPAPNAIEES